MVTVPLAASAKSAQASTSQVCPSSTWMDASEMRSLKFEPYRDIRAGTARMNCGASLWLACGSCSTASIKTGKWRSISPFLLPGSKAISGDPSAIAVTPSQLLPAGRWLHQTSQGMPNVPGVDPMRSEEIRLERENAEQLIDGSPHGRQTALSPSPNLGRDQVNHRNLQALSDGVPAASGNPGCRSGWRYRDAPLRPPGPVSDTRDRCAGCA